MNSRHQAREKVLESLDDFSPRFVVVETFMPSGKSSVAAIRLRPVPEEGFPAGTRVQCSRTMRI